MSNAQDRKQPQPGKPEPKITPPTGELEDRQLDDTSGGNQTAGAGPITRPPPAPVG